MNEKKTKYEFFEGMRPGAKIKMSPKSSYVYIDIHVSWLKNILTTPRKPIGKALLILDGHTSHTSYLEMLEYAEQNDVILLSLPPLHSLAANSWSPIFHVPKEKLLSCLQEFYLK